MYLQAIKPEINELKNEIINVFWLVRLIEVELLKNKKNSKIVIPIIGTKTMIKENSAASFFDVLRNRAVEIVKPDLEIPGTTAIACAIPMINALNRLIEFLPSDMKLVVSKIIPVIINIIATTR